MTREFLAVGTQGLEKVVGYFGKHTKKRKNSPKTTNKKTPTKIKQKKRWWVEFWRLAIICQTGG